MEMDNASQETPVAQVPIENQPIHKNILNQKVGFIVLLGIILIILVIGIGGYYLGTGKNQSPQSSSQTNQITPSASQMPKAAASDFFLFSIPKPLQDLTIFQLPNTENPRNVVQYKGSLWFAGGGNLVEYDTKSGKLVSYSNMTKANCDSNVVIANNLLFTSCHTDNIEDAFGHAEQLTSKIYTGHYSVFKINPLTHKVEHIFSKEDGLLNGYNYELFADGDTVWVQTFQGIGSINASTNQVKFYTNELGIPGSTLSVRTMFVDQNYVWVAVNANVGSQGGLSMYDKKSQTWKAFNVRDLKDYTFDRFDLEAGFKTIPGGIQIAFRDGNLETSDRLIEKQYNYQTGQWTKVNIERPASGVQSEPTRQYITATYPPPFNYQKVDQFGLTQLQLPDSKQAYQLDGRDNYILSSIIGNKRYILTSATVDVIDDSSPLPQILVKLGRLPSSGVSYGDPSAYEGLVSFLIDSDNSLAVVTDSACGGYGCSGKEKVSLIDLKSAKINRTYIKADGINGESLFGLSMNREGDLLIIKDKNQKPLFNIDTTTSNLTVLNQ